MTVFHVFFLVLVMWAVHSHGRAYETESIIYNNTLLLYKENMNIETVIHRIKKPFNYFYLVLQWPESFCTWVGGPCWQPIPSQFTVHGLWPQQTGVPRVNCTGAVYFPFDTRPLSNEALFRMLNSSWLNLEDNGKTNKDFWKYEYRMHGTCFLSTQEFFESTVSIMKKIPDLIQGGFIKPGTSYLFDDLQKTIIGATGFVPILQCVKGTQILYQILFCANKANDLVSCDSYPSTPVNKNCRGRVELPQTHRPRSWTTN